MPILKKYHKPSKEELAALASEDVERMDSENKALFQQNTGYTEAAKTVALLVDPTNKNIRDIHYPQPTRLREAWNQIQTEKAEKEAMQQKR